MWSQCLPLSQLFWRNLSFKQCTHTIIRKRTHHPIRSHALFLNTITSAESVGWCGVLRYCHTCVPSGLSGKNLVSVQNTLSKAKTSCHGRLAHSYLANLVSSWSSTCFKHLLHARALKPDTHVCSSYQRADKSASSIHVCACVCLHACMFVHACACDVRHFSSLRPLSSSTICTWHAKPSGSQRTC